MHADLVGAAGLERDAEERVLAVGLEHLEMGDRLAGRVGVERPAGRIVAVAADRRLDPAAARGGAAAHEGEVGAFELRAA